MGSDLSRNLLACIPAVALAVLTALAQAPPVDTGKSHNTKLWYAGQVPTTVRQEGLRFDGIGQRAVITSDASMLAFGQSSAALGVAGSDRFSIRLLLNLDSVPPAAPQSLVMIGGASHGWGVGISPNGKLFLVVLNGENGLRAVGCPAPADGLQHEVTLAIDDAGATISIDGAPQVVITAAEGAGVGLDMSVIGGAAIGGRAPDTTNLFQSAFAHASDISSLEAVMGSAALYGDPLDEMWFSGALSFLEISRGASMTVSEAWPLDEGSGVPVGSLPMESMTATWGGATRDQFLFHWPLATLSYDLGSTGATSPTNAPIVGTGPMGLSSWSDDGAYGNPVMAQGPIGVAARTQVQAAPRHSELFVATPLYNVEDYYVAWTGFVDSSTFPLPGALTGSLRLNRFSNGDSASGDPAALLLEPGPRGIPRLSVFGQGIDEVEIDTVIPFDAPYRAFMRYRPSTSPGVVSDGVIALSMDGGLTWPLSMTHNRGDNYHSRLGWRTNSLFGGRHWVRDMAYGSDAQEVWEATTANGPDLDGDLDVDGEDLAMLLSAWGSADVVADLDGDGVVDAEDLAILLAAWST